MTSPVTPSDRVEPIDVTSTPVGEPVTPIEVETTRTSAEDASADKVRIEEFSINGDSLVAKVRELLHQGNIRRIIVKNEDGRILIEIPLTVGVVGGALAAALFPVLAALGVIGAMVAHLTLVVERKQ